MLREREALHERLAQLCGISRTAWNGRRATIVERVRRMRDHVNLARRKRLRAAAVNDRPRGEESAFDEVLRWARAAVTPIEVSQPMEPITVAEELDYHVLATDIPLAAIAAIEGQTNEFPGVRIIEQRARTYPKGLLAAHMIGYLASGGEGEGSNRTGRSGVEGQYEQALRGENGLMIEACDRSGRVITTRRSVEPGLGKDVLLTMDPQLQASAEELLADGLRRRFSSAAQASVSGGAVVVMHAQSGALLAAASAPSFDPAIFSRDQPKATAALLSDAAHPLLNRCVQMQIPPGSIFKLVSAIALLEAGLDPGETLCCRGYLHHPDAQRCAVFVRHGRGHGNVALRDALVESCNVFFFHHASRLDPNALLDSAASLGLGRATGIDLPGEASGSLGTAFKDTHPALRDAQATAIGQGRLLVTPLQIACLMGAIANGGYLVTPHVLNRVAAPDGGGQQAADGEAYDATAATGPRRIDALHQETMELLRAALADVVAAPDGTAHDVEHLTKVSLAGKTGTAEVGDTADHAWFAGYAPAERPSVVVVVALEHAGSGGSAAAPLASLLVERMRNLGYFSERRGRQIASMAAP